MTPDNRMGEGRMLETHIARLVRLGEDETDSYLRYARKCGIRCDAPGSMRQLADQKSGLTSREGFAGDFSVSPGVGGARFEASVPGRCKNLCGDMGKYKTTICDHHPSPSCLA